MVSFAYCQSNLAKQWTSLRDARNAARDAGDAAGDARTVAGYVRDGRGRAGTRETQGTGRGTGRAGDAPGDAAGHAGAARDAPDAGREAGDARDAGDAPEDAENTRDAEDAEDPMRLGCFEDANITELTAMAESRSRMLLGTGSLLSWQRWMNLDGGCF